MSFIYRKSRVTTDSFQVNFRWIQIKCSRTYPFPRLLKTENHKQHNARISEIKESNTFVPVSRGSIAPFVLPPGLPPPPPPTHTHLDWTVINCLIVLWKLTVKSPIHSDPGGDRTTMRACKELVTGSGQACRQVCRQVGRASGWRGGGTPVVWECKCANLDRL